MKIVGKFAELRSKDLIEKNQGQRLQYFEADDKKYIMSCHGTLMREEENYNFCTFAVLGKLKIDYAVFQQTESEIMYDP